jgi:hypothetical protein
VTVNDVIYQRRIRAVAHANQICNITQAADVFGISRQPMQVIWSGSTRSTSATSRASGRCGNHGDWMRGRTPIEVRTSDQQRAELSPRSVVGTS